MLQNVVEAVYRTRKKAGVVFKGRNNHREEDVYDAVATELYKYFSKDWENEHLTPRIMPTCFFKDEGEHSFYVPERNIHRFPVFVAEIPEIEYRYWEDNKGNTQRSQISGSPERIGSVDLIQLDTERRDEYESKWDFAHAPHRVCKQGFLAYFSIFRTDREAGVDASASEKERDRFLRYTVRKNPDIKTNF